MRPFCHLAMVLSFVTSVMSAEAQPAALRPQRRSEAALPGYRFANPYDFNEVTQDRATLRQFLQAHVADVLPTARWASVDALTNAILAARPPDGFGTWKQVTQRLGLQLNGSLIRQLQEVAFIQPASLPVEPVWISLGGHEEPWEGEEVIRHLELLLRHLPEGIRVVLFSESAAGPTDNIPKRLGMVGEEE